MPPKIANIAKNTSYFTLALIIQKIISFSYFTLLARNLPPEDLGKYYFAISFTTIFAVFIDIGLANLITREVAKDQARAQSIVSQSLGLKIPLTVLTLGGLILLINLLGYPALTRQLVYVSAVTMVLDSFTLVFFAAIRGFHNLVYESAASVIFQLIVLALGVAALYRGAGLVWLMAILAVASTVNFCLAAGLLRIKWRIRLRPVFEFGFARALFMTTLPFGLYAVIQRLFTYFDTVLLSLLAGDRYVGLYQVAFKIIFALQFLPMAFVASLYPAFAAYWQSNRGQLAVTFERSMSYLLIISVPITAGVIILAPDIVAVFRSGYTDAVWPLSIAMLALVFLFLNFPVGSLLNACDRQRRNTVNIAVATAVSIGLNLALIPLTQHYYRNGAIGASIAVVVSNLVMLGLGLMVVPGLIKVRFGRILATAARVLAAAGLMMLLVFLLKPHVHIIPVVLAGGLAYFIFLLLVGGYRPEDVKSIYKSFSPGK